MILVAYGGGLCLMHIITTLKHKGLCVLVLPLLVVYPHMLGGVVNMEISFNLSA